MYGAKLVKTDHSILRFVVQLLRAAEDAEILSVLPALYYQLRCKSKSLEPLDPTNLLPLDIIPAAWSSDRLKQLESLGATHPAYLCRLFLASEWLQATASRLLSALATKANQRECHVRINGICSPPIREFWEDKQSNGEAFSSFDPLVDLLYMKDDFDAFDDLCTGCRNHNLGTIDAGRRYLWDSLPLFFGLKERQADQDYSLTKYL